MEWERVLIVEDEENERSGLAELISAWGYRTETASDGVQGLEKILLWNPGIVSPISKCPIWMALNCSAASRKLRENFHSFCSPLKALLTPRSPP